MVLWTQKRALSHFTLYYRTYYIPHEFVDSFNSNCAFQPPPSNQEIKIVGRLGLISTHIIVRDAEEAEEAKGKEADAEEADAEEADAEEAEAEEEEEEEEEES